MTRKPAFASKRAVAACTAIALLLSGCGSAPVVPSASTADEAPAASSPPTSLSAFETAQRQGAKEAERQGRLADAAWSWEVLSVLKPDNAEYRESLAAVRRQIDSAVADRLQLAAQARKRGEIEAASTQYLGVLSLQPDNAQAADALRAIERDRNKRSYLGKLSRITLARRTPESDKPGANAPHAAADRNDLEHASLLATQGELDEAIALLERRVAADRRDTTARQMLADLYVQKADKLAVRNKPAAIASLQKGLKLDPANPRAATMLKLLQGEPAASGGPGDAAARLR